MKHLLSILLLLAWVPGGGENGKYCTESPIFPLIILFYPISFHVFNFSSYLCTAMPRWWNW